MGERVKAHYGETKAENPYLDKDYAECRTSFVVGKHECWPIPQEQIDLMGKENFPQNEELVLSDCYLKNMMSNEKNNISVIDFKSGAAFLCR